MKSLGGLMAVLFVITAVPALLLTNLAHIVTDRAIMKTAVAASGKVLVTAAPEVIVTALQQQAEEQGLPSVPVDTAVLADAINELLPPDWLDAQTDTAVDAFFDALETGEIVGTAVELDVAPLLERLRGEPGLQAISVIIHSLPACTEPISGYDPQTGEIVIPNCLPSDLNADEVTQQVHTALVDTLDQNPQIDEEIGVVSLPLLANEPTSQAQADFQRTRRTFLLLQQRAYLLWLPPLLCLLLIVLFAVRSLGEWGRWWGWPLLLTAVITLFLAFALPALLTFMTRTAVLTTTPDDSLTLSLDQMLRELARPLLALWQRRIFIQAGVTFASGVLFLLLGWFARSPASKKEELYWT
ncbi:MAG: hypothetical protein H6664_11375 [Ardenticatenaceae bacterium]|nr:hypothetical protein [Ardenticatenaceae bacterium]MCB9004964.1 hypothetical protein [Ardenticatenaceae bacterium]